MTCFILSFILIFACSSFCSTFQIDVIRNLGGDNKHLGYAQSLLAISEVPVIFFFERLYRRWGVDKILVSVVIFALLKCFCQSFAPNLFIFLLAQVIQMLGFGMSYTASIYFIMKNIPSADKVKGQGFFNVATNGIGTSLASFGSGIIYDHWGLKNLLVIGILAGVFSVIAMTVTANLPRERKQVKYQVTAA